MDKVAAARAGLIRVVHERGEDHRIPCSLCGMPCEPDKLTRVFEDQDLCPECFNIHAYFTMDPELYLEYLKTEAQKNAENLSGVSRG